MAREIIVKEKPNSLTFKYILEPYKGRSSRHTCPNCGAKNSFARFIDSTTGEYFSDEHGRCNRGEKCGYFKVPTNKELGDTPYMVSKTLVKPQFKNDCNSISYIDIKTVMTSMSLKDNFSKFLLKRFGNDAIETLVKYYVGESSKWPGATIFWQLDTDSYARTGKIIQYDDTGHRVKEPYPRIAWAHSPDKDLESIPDYNLTQCLFGEHLITDSTKACKIVEAEKTAIICDIMEKDESTVWLATGGLEQLSESKLEVLTGIKTIFYPDKGEVAQSKWDKKLKSFNLDFEYVINKSLDKTDLPDGSDLADLIITKYV